MGLYGPVKGIPVKAPGKDHQDLAVALQKPEYRDLPGSTAPVLALAHSAEVCLVDLDLTGKLAELTLPLGGYALPDEGMAP